MTSPIARRSWSTSRGASWAVASIIIPLRPDRPRGRGAVAGVGAIVRRPGAAGDVRASASTGGRGGRSEVALAGHRIDDARSAGLVDRQAKAARRVERGARARRQLDRPL